jgi:hypothetical protein
MNMDNQIPVVDKWNPQPEDIIFTNSKNIILAPVSRYFHLEVNQDTEKVNYFMVKPKKGYNSDDFRNHCCLYLNYFEKYFDQEKEYFTNLCHIKYLIDGYSEYDKNAFMNDIIKYIIQSSLFYKTANMVEYNYNLELSYSSTSNPQLQYTDRHAKILMQQSILMNMVIPLVTHFAYMRKITEIDEFLLDVYDIIIFAPPFEGVDIPAKIYETSLSNVSKNEKNNIVIWNKQGIRGKDTITHSMDARKNIIIIIMPKYTFDKSMVSLNYTSIQKSNKYQITDIAYEYSYIPLSSSKRDGEDNVSEYDKFEANLIRQNEALYMQAKVNYQFTMKKIEDMWGPFDDNVISFYRKNLINDETGEIKNDFQQQLIFNLFYKYFGDTESIKGINQIDYIKMMLISKKMLKQNMMIYLPYVLSGKVEKIVSRKTLNKIEQNKMIQSQNWPLVQDKYKNEKMQKKILSTIATIITSTFRIIDYNDPEINGQILCVDPSRIIEETLLYILLI